MNFFREKVHYETRHWPEKKQQFYSWCGLEAPARSAKGPGHWREPKKTLRLFHDYKILDSKKSLDHFGLAYV